MVQCTVRAQLTSPLEIFQILISTEGRIVTVLENGCYGILNERERGGGKGRGKGGNEDCMYDDNKGTRH